MKIKQEEKEIEARDRMIKARDSMIWDRDRKIQARVRTIEAQKQTIRDLRADLNRREPVRFFWTKPRTKAVRGHDHMPSAHNPMDRVPEPKRTRRARSPVARPNDHGIRDQDLTVRGEFGTIQQPTQPVHEMSVAALKVSNS